MESKVFSLIIFFSIFASTLCGKFFTEKPAFIHTCQISDPNVDECGRIQLQSLYDELSNKENVLKGIPRYDPFHLKQMKMSQESGNLVFKAVFSDMEVTGVRNMKLKSCKFTDNALKREVRAFIPKLRAECRYNVNGKIIQFDLNANGTMWLEVDEIDLNIKYDHQPYVKDGYTFMNNTKISTKVNNIGNLKVNLDNLIPNNKDLEKTINDFFNENWKDVFQAFKPIVTKTMERMLLENSQKIFKQIPAKFFFSDFESFHKI